MAEMAEMLEEVAAGKARPVVLIEGDEYLARTSARELADAIVPEKDRALNLVILDAAAGARSLAGKAAARRRAPAAQAGAAGGLGSGGSGARLEDRRFGGEVAQGDRRGARRGRQGVAAGAYRLGAGPERRCAAGRSGGPDQDGGA